MGEDTKETIEVMVNAEVDSAVGYIRISRYVDKMTARKILKMIMPKIKVHPKQGLKKLRRLEEEAKK